MKNHLKKISVGLTAMLCAGLCTSAAYAEDAAVVYHSETGYTAEKITHPEKGVKEIDGIVDYTGNGTMGVNLGIGDRGQNYSWGSIGYGDDMYIGTCYGAWMNTLTFMKTALFREDKGNMRL